MSDNVLEILSNNLSRYMARKGWSPADLARATKTDPSALSRILTGENKNPSIQTLIKFADKLDTTPARLIGEESEFATVPPFEALAILDGALREISGMTAREWAALKHLKASGMLEGLAPPSQEEK